MTDKENRRENIQFIGIRDERTSIETERSKGNNGIL